MGMFSFIEKGLGLRTGATGAARDAKAAGELQLSEEQAFGREIQELTRPGIQQGQDAAQMYADYFMGSPEMQRKFIADTQASPMYSSMIDQGAQEVARYGTATGGFRGGNTQEALATSSQNVLNSLLNQRLQGLGSVSDYGLNQQNAYIGGKGGNIAQIGSTRSGISNVGIAKAAGKQNLLSGIVGAGASILGSGLLSGGSGGTV